MRQKRSVNLVAAVTAWLSLWYAAKPVDVDHTYGHKKIEYFSSGLEGVLILAAAVGIAWYAVRRLSYPEDAHEPIGRRGRGAGRVDHQSGRRHLRCFGSAADTDRSCWRPTASTCWPTS